MRSKSKAAYMISSVAEQYGVHPQTLRLYEREGLLKPSRSDGNTRLYTDEDLDRLEVILHLTRDLGVNLAGVEIILNMRQKMETMQQQIEQFDRETKAPRKVVDTIADFAANAGIVVGGVPVRPAPSTVKIGIH